MKNFAERLSLLYRISQTFNSSLDLDHVLNHVMDEVVAALQAERGFIVLGPAEECWVCRTARGMDQQTINAPDFRLSRSVVERVMNEGQPLLVNDALTDDQFGGHTSIISLRLRSILCVPLQLKDTIAGAIYVDNRSLTGVFSDDDLELLVAIAHQAAMAIENASLFQDLQAKLETLHLLQQVSTDLTSTLDLDTVLTVCLQRVLDLLSAACASVLIIEGHELVFRLALGEKAAQTKPFRIPLYQGLAGWVVQHAQGLYSNDVGNDQRFYAAVDGETGLMTQSLMAVPLIVNERPIGVIEVINKPGGFSDADLDLLLTIAGTAATAIDNARLYQLAVEKGRLERELQLARQVQANLIPRRTPDLAGWDVAAWWQPARQIGGDFYDFIPLESSAWGLVIADAADKGMPAALFMTLTRSVVRASVLGTPQPADGIARANQLICADAADGMFVTLFYAHLQPVSGALTYVNAGHNRPLFYQAGLDRLVELETTGMVLGVELHAHFGQRRVPLEVGDFILMYTDGVTDASDPGGQAYGLPRLQAIAWANRHAPAGQLAAALKADLAAFVASSDPFDDITFVVIHRQDDPQ